MPRMAQPGTTSNLRRLAGRRSPATGGPHIPLESSDYPPVLFRLPEVEVAAEALAPTTPSPAPSAVPMTPAPGVATPASPTPTTDTGASEVGQNVFNHVAGAVTGAVAGTVASSVAVAGTIAGSALAATPFGTAPGARPSFSSASTSLASSNATLETPASARSTPVVRPIPESAETDSRSWWEHWSSGIILMLLILALVTAGIMAIRDPDKTRNTQRSIADDSKTTTAPVKTTTESAPTAQTPALKETQPALADSNAASASPAASATLSPSLLPEDVATATEANKSKVPSFTLGPNTNTSANNTSGNGPALIADSSGFVSSAQPSPGAAASQGSASRLATGFANSTNSNGTPAISASTQLGKPQTENFEATVPATTADPGATNPNLTWPVEEKESATPANDQQSSATDSAGELKLSAAPAVTAPDLLPATEPTPAAAPATTTAASTATTASAAPTAAVATRPAYLETSLPNEDLESILEMRRQAMANSRVVSNQFYPASTSSAAMAANPNMGQPTPASTMPTYANGMGANGMGANGMGSSGMGQPQPQPQFQPQQYQTPTGATYQNGFNPAMVPQAQYPTQPNMIPAQQPVSYPTAPSVGAMNPTAVNPNAFQQNSMSYPPSTTTGVSSQAIGTRSWTYNPNTGTASGATNSWTLNQPGMSQPVNPSAQNASLTTNGGMQMDPNYARQLGYGQVNPSAPNVSASGAGWSNTNVQNRIPAANNPYGIINNQPPTMSSGAPNIAAPSGSMMTPTGVVR